MTRSAALIDTHPGDIGIDKGILVECIEACVECAQACTACADACLGEDMVAELVRCIRTDLDCADVCAATARVLSRQTDYDAGVTRSIVQACAQACQSCGSECERHAGMHEHCKVCAEACRRCEAACKAVLGAIG
jgi:hypothetical protein